jgi:hypothetical protein
VLYLQSITVAGQNSIFLLTRPIKGIRIVVLAPALVAVQVANLATVPYAR